MSNSANFWDEQSEHSRIKAEIVAAYLGPWAMIVGKYCDHLHYIDLFSGRGVYKDGARSTPLLVMDEVDKYPLLAKMLKIEFYEDKTPEMTKLKEVVTTHSAYESLKFTPKFNPTTITPEFVADLLGRVHKGMYTFIDPFGYKDISLEMVDVVTRNWGCDSVFYLSVAGLVRNIGSDDKIEHIREFFGRSAYDRIVQRLKAAPDEPDVARLILDETIRALREKRNYYTIPFLVEFDNAKRDCYYLVFLSEHYLGFKIMRDIMLKHGLKDKHGIPAPIYSELRKRELDQYSMKFVTKGDNLDALARKVISDFRGRTVLVKKLMVECLKKGYLFNNTHVRMALRHLRTTGKLKVVSAPSARIEENIGDRAVVQFL